MFILCGFILSGQGDMSLNLANNRQAVDYMLPVTYQD